jgi:hypothetical protein
MSKALYLFLLTLIVTGALTGCQKQVSEPSQTTPAPTAAPADLKPQPLAQAQAQKVYDGPFGLSHEIPFAEIENLKFKRMTSGSSVFTGQPPKPMDGVDEYFLIATPESGVCRISARANVEKVNATGDQLRAKVDQMAEMMAFKYGKHSDKMHYFSQDVYRRNSQFWMMGLSEDSIAYVYTWESKKTSQPLSENLDSIEVMAGAGSTDSGWVSIRYTYKNFDACAKDEKKRKASNL